MCIVIALESLVSLSSASAVLAATSTTIGSPMQCSVLSGREPCFARSHPFACLLFELAKVRAVEVIVFSDRDDILVPTMDALGWTGSGRVTCPPSTCRTLSMVGKSVGYAHVSIIIDTDATLWNKNLRDQVIEVSASAPLSCLAAIVKIFNVASVQSAARALSPAVSKRYLQTTLFRNFRVVIPSEMEGGEDLGLLVVSHGGAVVQSSPTHIVFAPIGEGAEAVVSPTDREVSEGIVMVDREYFFWCVTFLHIFPPSFFMSFKWKRSQAARSRKATQVHSPGVCFTRICPWNSWPNFSLAGPVTADVSRALSHAVAYCTMEVLLPPLPLKNLFPVAALRNVWTKLNVVVSVAEEVISGTTTSGNTQDDAAENRPEAALLDVPFEFTTSKEACRRKLPSTQQQQLVYRQVSHTLRHSSTLQTTVTIAPEVRSVSTQAQVSTQCAATATEEQLERALPDADEEVKPPEKVAPKSPPPPPGPVMFTVSVWFPQPLVATGKEAMTCVAQEIERSHASPRPSYLSMLLVEKAAEFRFSKVEDAKVFVNLKYIRIQKHICPIDPDIRSSESAAAVVVQPKPAPTASRTEVETTRPAAGKPLAWQEDTEGSQDKKRKRAPSPPKCSPVVSVGGFRPLPSPSAGELGGQGVQPWRVTPPPAPAAATYAPPSSAFPMNAEPPPYVRLSVQVNPMYTLPPYSNTKPPPPYGGILQTPQQLNVAQPQVNGGWLSAGAPPAAPPSAKSAGQPAVNVNNAPLPFIPPLPENEPPGWQAANPLPPAEVEPKPASSRNNGPAIEELGMTKLEREEVEAALREHDLTWNVLLVSPEKVLLFVQELYDCGFEEASRNLRRTFEIVTRYVNAWRATQSYS